MRKHHDVSVASRSIICRNRRLRQITDLLATDKSQYFAITEFNNYCFIINFDQRSFDQLNMSNHSLPAQGTDPPFSHKSVISITHKQNIISSKTLICRQLFAGHVQSSQPMKSKEKIHRMIIIIILPTSKCYFPDTKYKQNPNQTESNKVLRLIQSGLNL